MVSLQEISPVIYHSSETSPWVIDDQVEKLTQVMDIISKNKMLNSAMFVCGKDLRNFYFPHSEQDNLRGGKFRPLDEVCY
jgi:hypothetical protein